MPDCTPLRFLLALFGGWVQPTPTPTSGTHANLAFAIGQPQRHNFRCHTTIEYSDTTRPRKLLSLMRPTRLTTLVAAIASVAPLTSQSSRPTAADVRAKLRSKSELNIAWGAHLAAKHKLRLAIPDVRDALGRLAKVPKRNFRPCAALALLDACIHMHADVPATELRPWLRPLTRPAVMVLLAKKPKAYKELLLHIIDKQRDVYTWQAAGNLLASIRSKELVPRALRGFSSFYGLNVYSPGQPLDEPTGWSGLGFARTSPRWILVPRRYPPVALYRLELRNGQKVKSLQVLAKGATPVYYRRLLERKYKLRTMSPTLDQTDRQLEWLCTMLGIDIDEQPFQTWNAENIIYKGPGPYRKKVERARQKVEGDFRGLVARLHGAGLVQRNKVRHLHAKAKIIAYDRRPANADKLPALPGVKVQRLPLRPSDAKQKKK